MQTRGQSPIHAAVSGENVWSKVHGRSLFAVSEVAMTGGGSGGQVSRCIITTRHLLYRHPDALLVTVVRSGQPVNGRSTQPYGSRKVCGWVCEKGGWPNLTGTRVLIQNHAGTGVRAVSASERHSS